MGFIVHTLLFRWYLPIIMTRPSAQKVLSVSECGRQETARGREKRPRALVAGGPTGAEGAGLQTRGVDWERLGQADPQDSRHPGLSASKAAATPPRTIAEHTSPLLCFVNSF